MKGLIYIWAIGLGVACTIGVSVAEKPDSQPSTVTTVRDAGTGQAWNTPSRLTNSTPQTQPTTMPTSPTPKPKPKAASASKSKSGTFILSDSEWKKRLTPEQFYILRQKGTEKPFRGALLHNKKKGTYRCAGCNAPLFSSHTKFNSRTGWPSFYRSLPGRVERVEDRSHGMVRTEIICARCKGHLGHVFKDGPRPTGERHCVNSAAMTFEERKTR